MAGPVRYIPTELRFTNFRKEYYEDPTKRRRTTVLLDGSQTVEELNYQTQLRRKKIRLCLLKIGFGLLLLLIVIFIVEYYVYEVDMTIEMITFGSVLIILLLILVLLSICETHYQRNYSSSKNPDLEPPTQANLDNDQTVIQCSVETLSPDNATVMIEEKNVAVEPSSPTCGKLDSEK